MLTPATRAQHNRDHLRYTSDLTDTEWALIEPVLPAAAQTGRPRAWPMREVMNAILYTLHSGCPWRILPEHFPPHRTVWDWFSRLRDAEVFDRHGHRLIMLDRERCGREPSPSAAITHSQTARTCESGGPGSYDGAKTIVGRKRYALVDTDGRLLTVGIGAASL